MRWVKGEPSVENYGYQRSSIEDHTLDSNSRLCPLDNGKHTGLAKVDLGGVDKLPQEILEMVLEQLDLQSLTKFRRVNRRAMQAVDSIRTYQHTVTRFPTALRAILSIRTGASYSCQDLYRELQTAKCRTCGRFGGFLYLLTCRRVCAVCFTRNGAYIPIQRSDVLNGRGLYARDLATLPSMRTIPGSYTRENIPCKRRLILYDLTAVTNIAIARYGSLDAAWEPMETADSARCNKRAGARAHRDRNSMEPRRFMAVIRAPVFKGSELEWGVHCKECRAWHGEERWNGPYAALMYDPKEFREHVERHRNQYYDESREPSPVELEQEAALIRQLRLLSDRLS